jgi:hypothetical protein
VTAVCWCGRESRGFYYQTTPIERRKAPKGQKRGSSLGHKVKPREFPKIHCCSMKCLDLVAEGAKYMENMTNNEIAALQAVSPRAGSWIDNVAGASDMATWAPDVWMSFLEHVVTCYIEELNKLVTK